MKYEHKCPTCIYLGEYEDKGKEYDLYCCPPAHGKLHTLVARYGNDGPEYLSGTPESETAFRALPLIEAMNRVTYFKQWNIV